MIDGKQDKYVVGLLGILLVMLVMIFIDHPEAEALLLGVDPVTQPLERQYRMRV